MLTFHPMYQRYATFEIEEMMAVKRTFLAMPPGGLIDFKHSRRGGHWRGGLINFLKIFGS